MQIQLSHLEIKDQIPHRTQNEISLPNEFATRFQLIVLTGVKFAFRVIIRASNQFNVFSLSRLAFVNITYVEIRTVIIEYTWDKHNAINPVL